MKLNQTQEDILIILYNRQKRGLNLEEIHKILKSPELLKKERQLAKLRINNE